MTRRTRAFALAAIAAALLWMWPAAVVRAQEAAPGVEEGVTEHLGATLPMDARFTAQDGREVTLGEVMTKPTLLGFVFFRCQGICPTFLMGVADAVNRLDLTPGKDYQVVCISFDPSDTPAEASRRLAEYSAQVKKPLPPGSWVFLTGREEEIRKVTGAAGFHYQADGDSFIHPVTLVVASPKGRIVQYLYGMTYVPSALQMAVANASKDRVGAPLVQTLLSCFSYQAKGRRVVANVTAAAGAAVVLTAMAFIGYLFFTDPKRKARRRGAAVKP